MSLGDNGEMVKKIIPLSYPWKPNSNNKWQPTGKLFHTGSHEELLAYENYEWRIIIETINKNGSLEEVVGEEPVGFQVDIAMRTKSQGNVVQNDESQNTTNLLIHREEQLNLTSRDANAITIALKEGPVIRGSTVNAKDEALVSKPNTKLGKELPADLEETKPINTHIVATRKSTAGKRSLIIELIKEKQLEVGLLETRIKNLSILNN
ncbi:hypothetical protein K2173_002142 [Erythroxylum novogranatense]|uniref:Uncharacterized protein n=1 Tax=Erythroxylum novogranatense TaxID=1862640 RepID=A0AAV8SPN8_9ROSI|nr:hypothetical protein K2173_002142 [Erythroxylum novogranatense]